MSSSKNNRLGQLKTSSSDEFDDLDLEDLDLDLDETMDMEDDLSFDDLNDVEDDDLSFDDGNTNKNINKMPVMDGRMSAKQAKSPGRGVASSSESDEELTPISEYILGTLIVRVVAARGLKTSRNNKTNNNSNNNNRNRNSRSNQRRIFHWPSNALSTFANVSFGNHVEQTETANGGEGSRNGSNPSWNRMDPPLLFDVTLPVPHLAQDGTSGSAKGISKDMDIEKSKGSAHSYASKDAFNKMPISTPSPPIPKPILSVSVFQCATDSSHLQSLINGNEKGKPKKYQQKTPPRPTKPQKSSASDQDYFVGLAAIDVTPIITGKLNCIDQWLVLGGADEVDGEDIGGSVRVIIEYECAESEPRPGDKVQFTGFIHPTLCPLPKGQIFVVEEVVGDTNGDGGDEVVLSYYTPGENWKCTFQVHRFMLIPVERHISAMEWYQDEIMEITNNLLRSPAAKVVKETMKKLPEEGLLFVGLQAAMGGLSLLGKWKDEGVKCAVDDFVYATNLNGKHTSGGAALLGNEDSDSDLLSEDESSTGSGLEEDGDESSIGTDADYSVASGMPCCPISGEPMRRPVSSYNIYLFDNGYFDIPCLLALTSICNAIASDFMFSSQRWLRRMATLMIAIASEGGLRPVI